MFILVVAPLTRLVIPSLLVVLDVRIVTWLLVDLDLLVGRLPLTGFLPFGHQHVPGGDGRWLG
jgi:hypothetical protein